MSEAKVVGVLEQRVHELEWGMKAPASWVDELEWPPMSAARAAATSRATRRRASCFTSIVVVLGVALTDVACRGSESAPGAPPSSADAPPAIDARVAGEHCITADPLAYFFQKKPHTEAEIRQHKALARKVEPTRFTIDGTGAVRVTGIDGRMRVGTVVSVRGIDAGQLVGTDWQAGQSLTIRWQGEPPPPPVLSGTKANFTWTKDGSIVLAGAAGVLLQLVRPGTLMCVDADLAWLRDPAVPPTPAPASAVAPTAWATTDPAKWPQIVFTNEASFHGSTPLQGASSFLVEDKGRIVLATALHLIGDDGGVEPAVSLPSFDRQLESWSAYVRTRPEPSVRATSLAMAPVDDEAAADWLLLKIAPSRSAAPPATPLRLRDTPVALGERISLIGCEYKDTGCTQGVIGGRVTARSGHAFRYELDRPTELRGFSGAPIVDAFGRVVGVMSVWFTPFTIGEAYLEGGGQDATVARKLLVPAS